MISIMGTQEVIKLKKRILAFLLALAVLFCGAVTFAEDEDWDDDEDFGDEELTDDEFEEEEGKTDRAPSPFGRGCGAER